MKYTKPLIVVSMHVAPPFLGAWSSHLWDHGHEGLGLFMIIIAVLTAFGMLMRDLWLDEQLEAISPTKLWHGSTVIEPPRPLPAFSAEENPSRVRIRPLVERGPYASVAPPDADNENTEKEVG
jgi:hypothetical protein